MPTGSRAAPVIGYPAATVPAVTGTNYLAGRYHPTHPPYGASRGFRLRRLRQAAGLRHERLALAPPLAAPLEPEHSARAGQGERHAAAAERVYLVHQGGQGHTLALLAELAPRRGV